MIVHSVRRRDEPGTQSVRAAVLPDLGEAFPDLHTAAPVLYLGEVLRSGAAVVWRHVLLVSAAHGDQSAVTISSGDGLAVSSYSSRVNPCSCAASMLCRIDSKTASSSTVSR